MHPLDSLWHIGCRVRKRPAIYLEIVVAQSVQTISLLPLQIPIDVEVGVAKAHIHPLALLDELLYTFPAFLDGSSVVFGDEEVVGAGLELGACLGSLLGWRGCGGEDLGGFAEFGDGEACPDLVDGVLRWEPLLLLLGFVVCEGWWGA